MMKPRRAMVLFAVAASLLANNAPSWALAPPSTVTTPVFRKVTPNNPSNSGFYASSVAVSGDRVLVGNPDDVQFGAFAGAIYMYDLANPGGVEIKLSGFDADSPDRFGYAVDIDGDFAIVGARQDTQSGFSAGSAYLLDLRNPGGVVQHKLLPSEVGGGDVFGTSVAISGTKAIVGAHGDDDTGDNGGAAYVFDFSDQDNITSHKIVASDLLVQSLVGASVDISGNTAIVGARAARNSFGSAYLYDLSDLNNIVETKLTPSVDSSGNEFGASVAVNGSMAIVGASQLNPGAGQAYLFDLSNPGAPQQHLLLASDPEWGDGFGESVSLSDQWAIVGAPFEDELGDYSGAAYAYDLSNLSSLTARKIVPADLLPRNRFGYGLAIDGNTLVVGAPSQLPIGAAYVFRIPEPATLTLALMLGASLLAWRKQSA